MGWVEKKPYVHPHYYCQKPSWDKTFGIGSKWQCSECGRVYRFDGRQGDQRDEYDKWTEVSSPNIETPNITYWGPYNNPLK